jgi:hypothetical protein
MLRGERLAYFAASAVFVLVEFLVVVHAGLAVLINEAKLELVEVACAETKLAGVMFAPRFFAMHRTGFRLLFIAHFLLPLLSPFR